MKYVDLKKMIYMDFLIQKERTGSPERFARKMELSRSTFFEYISYLRNELMLQINYDEYRETYYYEGRSQMEILFHYVEDRLSSGSPFPIIFNRTILDKSYYTCTTGSKDFKGAECSALNTHLFVLPDGKASICEQLYWNPLFLIGDLKKSSLKDIWMSDKCLRLANIQQENIGNNSPCKHCNLFTSCFSYRNRCWVDIIKAYGKEHWDYPDPRCEKAFKMQNNLGYE